MKISIKKVIIGSFLLAATASYANVPTDSKFRAITYDNKTKHFIAVGKNASSNIVAVSDDGEKWISHSIKEDGGGSDINMVSVSDEGEIFLTDEEGTYFVRDLTEEAGPWTFKKVVSSTSGQVISQVDIPVPLKYRNAFANNGNEIIRIVYKIVQANPTSRQLIEAKCYKVGNNTSIDCKSKVRTLKTDSNLKKVLLLDVTGEKDKALKYAVFYETTAGDFFKATDDDHISFTPVQNIEVDPKADSFTSTTAVHAGLSIFVTTFEPLSMKERICNLFSAKCVEVSDNNSATSTGHKINSVFSGNVNGDEEVSIVTSDADKHTGKRKVNVIAGSYKAGVFTVKGTMTDFDMADRTGMAMRPDGLRVVVGEDNKVLQSRDGMSWIVKTM